MLPPTVVTSVNPSSDMAYVLLTNGTVGTAMLTKGAYASLSSGVVNASQDVVDLVANPQTGAVYIAFVHDAAISYLATVELAKLDPTTGNTYTVAKNKTSYPFFMAGAFDNINNRYLGVFASPDGDWQLLSIDVGYGTITEEVAPYGLASTAYAPAAGGLYGIIPQPSGESTFMSLNVATANATVVGKPLQAVFCGSTLAKGAYDSTTSQFVTLCCDNSFCSNVTSVTAINTGTGTVQQGFTIPAYQAPVGGIFLLNP